MATDIAPLRSYFSVTITAIETVSDSSMLRVTCDGMSDHWPSKLVMTMPAEPASFLRVGSILDVSIEERKN